MAISPIQKAAIEDIFDALMNITQGGRYKRHLTDAFLELPDKEEWADYYEIIPQPRSINIVRAKLNAENYENCLAAYADLALVFLNALHYNEEGSQIAQDAEKLRVRLFSAPTITGTALTCIHRVFCLPNGKHDKCFPHPLPLRPLKRLPKLSQPPRPPSFSQRH